ncbi:MAG: hypothetical protein QW728_00705 [Thermoplasmata archaeon]
MSWLDDIQNICAGSQKEYDEVVRQRAERLENYAKRVEELKKIVKKLIADVEKTMQEVKSENPAGTIEIQDEPEKLTIHFPKLSDVHNIVLVIVFKMKPETTVVESYRRDSWNREELMKAIEAEHELKNKQHLQQFEEYFQEVIKVHLKSWYTRRISDELDKDREIKYIFVAHPIEKYDEQRGRMVSDNMTYFPKKSDSGTSQKTKK